MSTAASFSPPWMKPRAPMHAREWFLAALVSLAPLSSDWAQEDKGPPAGPGAAPTQAAPGPSAESNAGVKDLFDTASGLIRQSRFREAADLLQKAETLSPGTPAIHHYLGYAWWKQDQWDAAQKEFQRAHELDPKDPYTLYFLARIAQSTSRAGEAIGYYERIGRLGTPVYDTNQRLGQLYLDAGNLENARQNIEAALKQTPWDSSLYYQLGRVDQRTGHPAAAREEFASAARLKNANQDAVQRLLALDQVLRNGEAGRAAELRTDLLRVASHDPEILESMGVVLGRAGLYEQAREPLERCVQIDPESFEAEYNLGFTLLRLQRDQDAEAALRRALKLRPDSVEANRALAVLYVEQNRNLDAIQSLRNASRILPGDAKVLALLGQQYLEGRFLPNAVSTLEEAVKLAPENLDVRSLLVQAYDAAHEYDAGLKTARVSLRLFPDSGRAAYEVAQELAASGQYDDAYPYADQAVQKEPRLVEAWNLLGDLESKRGRYDRALQAFERAHSADKGNVAAARGVADNLMHLGRYNEALAAVQEALAAHPDDAALHFILMQAYVRTGQRERAAQTAAVYQRLRAAEAAQADAQKPRPYPGSKPAP